MGGLVSESSVMGVLRLPSEFYFLTGELKLRRSSITTFTGEVTTFYSGYSLLSYFSVSAALVFMFYG
jgi:hypothetical protein